MNCSIVVLESVSPAKKRDLRLGGAQLTLYGRDCVEVETRAREMATVGIHEHTY